MNVWMWLFMWCSCWQRESLAGRIYIYIYIKYGWNRFVSMDLRTQNQLCKDIFNVMHNKATKQPNKQPAQCHNAPQYSIGGVEHTRMQCNFSLALCVFCPTEPPTTMAKKFNCPGVRHCNFRYVLSNLSLFVHYVCLSVAPVQPENFEYENFRGKCTFCVINRHTRRWTAILCISLGALICHLCEKMPCIQNV